MQTYQLAARCGELLLAKQQLLATAESCTGGGIAAAMTAVPGSSAWFDCGFVSYSNAAKQAMLAVPATLLAAHGAVSEPVVRAMVAGTLSQSRATIACAVSGVAGPGGGTVAKPVGYVWIAYGSVIATEAELLQLDGNRDAIRAMTCDIILRRLVDFLQ